MLTRNGDDDGVGSSVVGVVVVSGCWCWPGTTHLEFDNLDWSWTLEQLNSLLLSTVNVCVRSCVFGLPFLKIPEAASSSREVRCPRLFGRRHFVRQFPVQLDVMEIWPKPTNFQGKGTVVTQRICLWQLSSSLNFIVLCLFLSCHKLVEVA